jgi:thiazole/oxazole-forming peptide maturase SagC family component
VVDEPTFRNVRFFDDGERLISQRWGLCAPEPFETWKDALPSGETTCLVVCSDFGGLQRLAEWNALAHGRGWHFLPVVLQNAVGLVGPLVIPGETACFQCLLVREEANSPSVAIKRATEVFAFEGQLIAAYHPSMASALGDVAAMELTKHYAYGWTSAAIGNAIEVNLLTATMQPRPILQAPNCPVCSPLNFRGRMGLLRDRVAGS